MLKISISIMVATVFLVAKPPENIHFKEKRYIYALNNTISRNGIINASKDKLTISYNKTGKKLVYAKKSLTITEKNSTKVIDLDKDIVMKTFFELLNAIIHDNTGHLSNMFKITSKNGERTMIPDNMLSRRIKKIVYKKSKKLDYLYIILQNNDRISIEQID